MSGLQHARQIVSPKHIERVCASVCLSCLVYVDREELGLTEGGDRMGDGGGALLICVRYRERERES